MLEIISRRRSWSKVSILTLEKFQPKREEIGEALRAVDFEQLNIENKDCARLIEEKNRYVFDMKKIAGHYHLQLTQRKQALSDLLRTLNTVKKEIALKKDQIEELEVEGVIVEEDTRRMDQRLKKMLNFIDNYTAPEILDFVVLMSELEELQKTYKRLNRYRGTKRIVFQSSKKQSQGDKRSSDTRRSTTSKKMSDTVSPPTVQDETSSSTIVA
ncbi:cilia- and flagella-associated protein 263 [Ptiloglossa arizonensis]|uniref:cilia- and flagella-associated protein 263 n=1 Tax=Ptiloglossa arizonensis TaxID=3350558 RepID=UPI003FA15038